MLTLDPGAAATDVAAALRGHVLGAGTLVGLYERR
jgi:phosphatidylethanolamine-binding protein (PEBP) family uncharacterized protein